MSKGAKLAIKIPSIIIGVILILLLIATFAAGPIAKSYINNNCEELCGRIIKVDKISTNLFFGKAKIIGFEMLEDNKTDKFCSFDTLIIRINPFKLLANEIKLNEITLISPEAAIIQDGDSFNFDSLIEFFDSDEEEETDEEESSWDINLNEITLKNGSILYKDLAIGSKFNLNNLQLGIPHIYFSGQNTDVGIDLDFAEGGKLNLKVAYEMEKGLYDLNICLNDFSLSPVLPYLQDFMYVSEFNGKLNTEMSVKGDIDHIMEIVAKGKLNVSDVSLLDNDEKEVLTAQSFVIDIDKIDLKKNSYIINAIEIDGLETEYIVFDTLTTNFDKLFKEDDTAEEADDSESSDDMLLNVKSFVINNSNVTYIDKSLVETFELPISKINVNIDNLNLVSQFKAKIKAFVGDKGELSGSFSGSLSNFSNMRLNLSLKNIKMKDLSPYCVHYTAYPITDGLLSLTSNNTINDNYLTSSNEVNILNCTVEKKRKDIDA
ncbi:MAG: DUF748 domain-containing protein, partial [Bacteroidales bacterium]|nr:DUF748 domain-containing protein [Bacteroidales bacterium]